jgi:hypothetical protein
MGARHRYQKDAPYYVCEDALDDAGYILTFKDAVVVGNVSKTDALGEPPVGVNLMSTKNPVTEVAEASKVVAVLDDGEAWVKLEPAATRTINIVVGDWVQGSAQGMAEGMEAIFSNIAYIDKVIGQSLQTVGETVDLPTAGVKPYKTGYLLVKLRPRGA